MGKGLRGYKIGIMIQKGIIYLFLLIFAMGFLLPFFFLLTGSFKTSSELFSVPYRWFPKRITLENYQQVLGTGADGVAVVSGILGTDSISDAVTRFLR